MLSNWLSWASSACELGVDEAGHVLHVVGLVGLPQEDRGRPVGVEPVLAVEVRIARRHHPFAQQQPGVAVVGVQPIALPRVVAEHDVRTQLTDHTRHPAAQLEPAVQLAVDLLEEHDLAGPVAREPARGLALLLPARGDAAPQCRPRASHVPFDPSVSTRWCTTQPAAAHLARVPPAPNSTSSGWAPTASAEAGTGMSRRVPLAGGSQRGSGLGLARFVGSHAGSTSCTMGCVRSAGMSMSSASNGSRRTSTGTPAAMAWARCRRNEAAP